MNHDKRALVDVDGVVGKFHEKARASIQKIFGLDIPLSDFVTWDVTAVLPTQEMRDRLNAHIAEPGFAAAMEPYTEAVTAIAEIRRLVEFRFVTTPHTISKTWMQERREWLIHHFGVQHEEIMQVHLKYEVVGGLFLDDKPSNVRRWSRYHPDRTALLWDQPYNRSSEADGLRRVTSWEEVLDEVRKL